MSHFTIARLIASAALLLALGPMPYAFYTLMRILVCGTAAYGAYVALDKNRKGWLWVFGIVAIVFNPLVPVRMDRDSWALVDFVAAIALLLSFTSRALSETPSRQVGSPASSE